MGKPNEMTVCANCDEVFEIRTAVSNRCPKCTSIKLYPLSLWLKPVRPAKEPVKPLNKTLYALPIRRCRVCGCTDEDCSKCIERKGVPCVWVDEDLCSACASDIDDSAILSFQRRLYV